MLKKSILSVGYLCSQQPKPTLVKITAILRNKEYVYQFPQNSKLGPNLERMRVPLQFECGFSCSCGTCSVSLSEQDYSSLQKEQPVQKQQENVLCQNNFETNVRLSCQLTVKPYFQKYKFIIDV